MALASFPRFWRLLEALENAQNVRCFSFLAHRGLTNNSSLDVFNLVSARARFHLNNVTQRFGLYMTNLETIDRELYR
jgi:hypothetical protein